MEKSQCSAITSNGKRCKNQTIEGSEYCRLHTNNKTRTLWYKNPTLLLAIISILTSTTVGLLTVYNSNHIALLDKEIYIPKLIYQITQREKDILRFEVINQGVVSAQDVTVNIEWQKSALNLESCKASPPYQDISPISPLVEENFTFRITSLDVGSTLGVDCKFSLNISDEINSRIATETVPIDGEFIIYIDGTPVNLPLNSFSRYYLELSQDILIVSVTAVNAKPASEIAQRPKIYIPQPSVTIEFPLTITTPVKIELGTPSP